MAAASSIHINIFGPHPIVVYGSDAQRAEWLPPLIKGTEKCCFGVTEPDAGLDTGMIRTTATPVPGGYRGQWSENMDIDGAGGGQDPAFGTHQRARPKARRTDGLTLFYTDLDRRQIEIREIAKMGRAAVDSNQIFIDDLMVPERHRIGAEGKGFPISWTV